MEEHARSLNAQLDDLELRLKEMDEAADGQQQQVNATERAQLAVQLETLHIDLQGVMQRLAAPIAELEGGIPNPRVI